mmetsp:Transcript_30373/g.65179  ORF Transcript_30373/g.65179 Transcript_30373/m.65179 type:complete len:227 (+) Transcript_30373:97-777(+)
MRFRLVESKSSFERRVFLRCFLFVATFLYLCERSSGCVGYGTPSRFTVVPQSKYICSCSYNNALQSLNHSLVEIFFHQCVLQGTIYVFELEIKLQRITKKRGHTGIREGLLFRSVHWEQTVVLQPFDHSLELFYAYVRFHTNCLHRESHQLSQLDCFAAELTSQMNTGTQGHLLEACQGLNGFLAFLVGFSNGQHRVTNHYDRFRVSAVTLFERELSAAKNDGLLH